MTTQSQSLSLTFVHERSHSISFPQKHQAIGAKFHMEHPWDVGNENNWSNVPGHNTKMASRSTYDIKKRKKKKEKT